MAWACAEAGWAYRRAGGLDAVLVANVGWLSRYRHPRCAGAGEVADRLREVFVEPRPLWAGAGEVGDTLAVLPALFHLLWRQELVADLAAARLGFATLVRKAPARVGGSR
jgi:hypothetical protein